MTLPNNYSPFEHLQDVLRRVHNREVREAFSDLGGDEWIPDISTPRASLRQACTIDDKDTATMVAMRIHLFFLHLRKARDYQAPIYGQPVASAQAVRKHKPQVILYFKEDLADVESGYHPIDGRISYRLMEETPQSITKTELTVLANRIKLEFISNNGFVWRKGKDLASYVDKKKGYQFQLLVRSKTDAKALISKVLGTNQDTPNWNYLSYKESDNPTGAYPTIPGNQIILNKTYKEPRIRPIAEVRFQYAYCDIWGLPEPVILCDRSFTHLNPLVD